jgi:hypothetical protein
MSLTPKQLENVLQNLSKLDASLKKGLTDPAILALDLDGLAEFLKLNKDVIPTLRVSKDPNVLGKAVIDFIDRQSIASAPPSTPAKSARMIGRGELDMESIDFAKLYIGRLPDNTKESLTTASTLFNESVFGFTAEQALECAKVLLEGIDGIPAFEIIFASVLTAGQVRTKVDEVDLVSQLQKVLGISTTSADGKDQINLSAAKLIGYLFIHWLANDVTEFKEMNKKAGNPWEAGNFPETAAGKINAENRKSLNDPKAPEIKTVTDDKRVKALISVLKEMISNNKHAMTKDKKDDVVKNLKNFFDKN